MMYQFEEIYHENEGMRVPQTKSLKKAVMTSFNQNFQKMRKVSSQILAQVLYVKFHENRHQDAASKGCDRQHTDRQTHRQASSSFSNKMTEYK